MPLSMKIQPIDEKPGSTEPIKPAPMIVKSRLKRLFRISVSEPAPTVVPAQTGEIIFEPSSICLAKMVQNFIEESTEKPSVVKCGRNRCNCFNGNGSSDVSDTESDNNNNNNITSADVCDFLKSLVVCASVEERNVLADTARIVSEKKTCKRKDELRKVVVDGLIGLGYDAAICKSKWDKSSSFPAATRDNLGHQRQREKKRKRFPVVEPDPGHTKLRLSREGLKAIERIKTPISAVAVIGPYRSGKSFLLNQLLSLSCNEGFGVGHMRDTKTKGIWVWGVPIEVMVDGVKTSVVYLDTEGFESVGKSSVYDDRIFALATVMSSVLIYNLPETVREADISRLSFAVELAEEFYGRVKGEDVAFEPAKLLWLIQRDFLQGKSVQEMVNEALRRIPNYSGDKDIDQVNQIRESLAVMGDNSTAFSLPQPHLQRTRLCEMSDSELDPGYVKKREQLKEVVTSIIRPKIVQGKMLNGKEFVSFLEQIIEALNKGEIPSTGSLVEVFNKKIVERCLKLYSEKMSMLRLPLSEDLLIKGHEESKGAATKAFDEQHFGRQHAKKSYEQLDEEIDKVFKNFKMANQYESTKLCEMLYTTCEDRMDQLQVLRLPSMAKFNAGFSNCNESFQLQCVGPSKVNYENRMMKMMGKARSLFIKEYNNRLFNWLVAFSLVMVVVGRFIIKFFLLEIGAWVMFIFLETYTRLFWSAESLFYNPVWHVIVTTWETVVYSPVIDLDRWAIPLCVMAALFILYWRCYGRKKHGSSWLLPLYNSNSSSSRSRTD